MQNDMDNVLNMHTDKVFDIVAKCFADGGGDKNAKANVKENLRQIWHAARRKTCLEAGTAMHTLADKIFKDKGW